MRKTIAVSAALTVIALAARVIFTPIIEKPSFAQRPNATTTITGNVTRTAITGNATTTTPTNATRAATTNATTTIASASQLRNQGMRIMSGNATVLTLNNTVVPLEKTIISKQTITKPIDNAMLSKLGNITLTAAIPGNKSSTLDFSKIQNHTATVATGQATTTIISRTIIPYNVTMTQLALSAQNHTTTANTTVTQQDVQQLFQANSSRVSGNAITPS